ncbi:hypothetical protein POM88_025639 [Heracleum sosnowskyi]|uniref:Uncharacterized protein n=1 Tax=Heracleum sosnowskyi TaxID=360622 RepID=A0AAD8I7D7_9APIA|nr:hypothetical protein POM88_025639 [Heracleum sosnowskyi]
MMSCLSLTFAFPYISCYTTRGSLYKLWKSLRQPSKHLDRSWERQLVAEQICSAAGFGVYTQALILNEKPFFNEPRYDNALLLACRAYMEEIYRQINGATRIPETERGAN